MRSLVGRGHLWTLVVLSMLGCVLVGAVSGTALYVTLLKYDSDPWMGALNAVWIARRTNGMNVLDEDLRVFAHNLSVGCGLDEACIVGNVYVGIKDFEYVKEGGNHPPVWTLRSKSGNCVSLHMLYCGLLYQVGVGCRLNCSIRHCWAQVLDDGFVADLTVPTFMGAEDYFGMYGGGRSG